MHKEKEQIERTLLVGCDDSESALRACREATKFAGANDRIILLYVVPPLPWFAREQKFKSMTEDKVKESSQLLHATFTQMTDQGLCVEQFVCEGDPAQVIAGKAEAFDADVVIVGAGNTSHDGNELLGSVTNFLLHETKLPVLVVH